MQDLSASVIEAVRSVPGDLSRDVLAIREQVLGQIGHTRSAIMALEASEAAGHISAQACAEVWAWVTWMSVIRGNEIRTTAALYVRMVTLYLEWCFAEPVDYAVASMADMEAWQRWLYLARKHSAQHRTRQGYAVRSFYAWRSIHGIGANCGAHLRLPKEVRKMPRKYADDQVRAMLEAAATHPSPVTAQRDRLLILFLFATGCRREELSKLDVGDVDLGQRVGMVRVSGKGNKERVVPIEGPVVEELRRWLLARDQLRPDSQALFTTIQRPPGRMTLNAVERVVRRAAVGAGLREWGVHRFRVTYATALYDQGSDIEEIRILLGHSSIETTRRYISVSSRMRKTRIRAGHQHALLGQSAGVPSWVGQVIGGNHAVE